MSLDNNFVVPKPPAIAVVTATYNSASDISILIEALRAQTLGNFEWILQDGESSDDTVSLVKESGLNVSVESVRDGGIYDALNRALLRVNAPIYLVVGSDDILYPDTLRLVVEMFDKNPSALMVTGPVDTDKGRLYPFGGQSWRHGQNAFISNHSVGLALRTSVHMDFGWYSKKLPIAADQLLVKRVASSSPSAVVSCDTVFGRFGGCGVSSTDIAGLLCECYRVQLLTEPSPVFQTIVFVLKLLLNLRLIAAIARDTR